MATWLGITGAVVLYSVVGVSTHWNHAPSPAPFVSGAVLAVLASLFGCYLRRRPLLRVDRTYYRLAVLCIGIYGVMGTWSVGAALAGVLLAHSVVLDREVLPARGPHPVTKDAPG